SIGMAEAAGTPTKLITFTDKKIYEAWQVKVAKNGFDVGSSIAEERDQYLNVTVYAVVLDEEGTMLTGLSGVNGTLDDIERQDHFHKTDSTIHHNITYNPSYFYTTFNLYDNNSDGIYVGYADLTDMDDILADDFQDDHILINISADYSSLSTYTHILFTGLRCHNNGGGEGFTHQQHFGATTAAGGEPCTMCHTAYMHLYSDSQKYMQSSLLESGHFKNWKPATIPSADMASTPISGWHVNNSESANDNSGDAGWGGTDTDFVGAEYCFYCHYDNSGNVLDYGTIYPRDSSDRPTCNQPYSNPLTTYNESCHSATNITAAQMTSDVDWFWYDDPIQNKTHAQSANTPAVPCAVCHDAPHMGNLPQPSPSTYTDINEQCTYCHTSDGPSVAPHTVSTTDCTVCHKDDSGVLNAHEPTASSGGVECSSCHDISGSAGADIDITNTDSSAHANLNNLSQYTAGNASIRKCWACHGNSSNSYANETNQPDGHYSTYKTPKTCPDCHDNTDPNSNFNAPQAVEHTQGAPTVPTTGTKCSICHNNSLTTINEIDGFGISDSKNASVSHYLTTASLMTSSDCRWCHITNNLSADWGTPFDPQNGTNYAHTADNVALNANCYSCHGGLTASVKLHDTGITAGGSGGQDCVNCHDGTTGNKVNVDNMNNSDSIHVNLNTGGDANGRVENKMCYACHTNDSYINASGVVNNNSIPTSDHPTGYITPRNCTLCHINTNSSTNFSAPQVSEHYMSGTELQTRNYASNTNDSCISCHIENEMLQPYSDDAGTNYSNVSHYGKSRNNTALVASDVVNCTYCHDNGSSNTFDFVDTTNKTISNHSANYPLTTPECTLCHNEGRMHDGNLTIPTLDENLCTGCHTTRDNHNNSVSCLSCHVNSSLSRNKTHPIQYISALGIFSNSNTTAVNCTDCHQSGVTGFESAPIIPDPLRHSTNPANGSIWGSYWNNENGSCQYCHGDTRHNITALGNITNFKGSNVVGGDLSGTWCLGCHLNGSDNYNNMLGNLSSVPPEITAGDTNYPSSGSPKDHIGYTMTSDSDCTVCHAGDTTNITTYMHNLEVGQGGGRNCISCHDISQSTEKVDVSKMNTSTSIHNNLNNLATATNADNKRCWACHTNSSVSGDGQVDESELSDSDHPDGYNTPKNCTLCHIDN
ncbi:MAG: hypothetical protein KAJ55_02405, partial [Anaerolineales bacterium]|nr:hypothetical protein [Anaerolineales bacterium]